MKLYRFLSRDHLKHSKFQCNVASQPRWQRRRRPPFNESHWLKKCVRVLVSARLKLTTANFNRSQREIYRNTLEYYLYIFLGNNIYWFKFAYLRFFFVGPGWISVKIAFWARACVCVSVCALLTQVRNACLSHSCSQYVAVFSHHFIFFKLVFSSTCALSFIVLKLFS